MLLLGLFASILKISWTIFEWGISTVQRLGGFDPWNTGTSLALIFGVVLVIFPLVIYFVATWLRFCPRINRDDSWMY